MEPPDPTVSDEATVLSEYCMDGEARSPHRNLPYPDGTLEGDESSVRSVYYPSGVTESDEEESVDYSDSNLGTDPGYPDIDLRTTVSSDSSAHSIPPDDYNIRYRSLFRSPYSTSSSTSTTSSSSDSSVSSATPSLVAPITLPSDYEPGLRTARPPYQPELSEDDYDYESLWSDDSSSEIQRPPDEERLRDVIPSPYCDLVLGSLFDARYTPAELYEALGNAIEEVNVNEQWKMAEAENPLERARRIRKLRADDEIRSAPSTAASPEAFSRACGVCYADAPRTRAVLTACGHLVCAPCADTIARGGRLGCPYCRAPTGYVVLEEEEEGSLTTDDDASDAESKDEFDNGIKNPPVSCHIPLNN